MTITKATVERATPPDDGQAFIRDDELKGFALRVTANGVKSFIWEGRIRGRMRRITLGQYPDLSVLLARKAALKVKNAVAQGEDPAEKRKTEKAEPTFNDLAERYLEQHSRAHKKSWARDEKRINQHFARWKTRKLSDISQDEVTRLQHWIAQHHGQIASNRAMSLLRSMFNQAAHWGMFKDTNPATKLKFFHEEERERFLSEDEHRRVRDALAQETSPYWRAYFPLCLMLGTRRSELLAVRWSEIDWGQRTLRIPTTKAGKPHLLPLPGPAVDILRSLPSFGNGGFVFPGEGASGHLVEVKSAWDRIRKRAGVPDVRVHDLRRTLGSWLTAQGYSLTLVGKTLGHRSLRSTQIYARLDLGPMREALERNAALMVGANGAEVETEVVDQ